MREGGELPAFLLPVGRAPSPLERESYGGQQGHTRRPSIMIPLEVPGEKGVLEDGADEEDDTLQPISPTASSPYASRSNSIAHGGSSHARQPSRIHERNLSVFFPRPSPTSPGPRSSLSAGSSGSSTLSTSRSHSNGFDVGERVTDMPGAKNGAVEEGGARSGAANRRGHHHKHSVSHNLFTFMDADGGSGPVSDSGATHPIRRSSASIYGAPSPQSTTSSTHSHVGHSHSHHIPTPTSTTRITFTSLIRALVRLPWGIKSSLLLSGVQIVVGASLWVMGQSGESLSVTGLGYLVVFDGMGGVTGIVLEGQGIGGSLGMHDFWESLGMGRDERAGDVKIPFG